MTAERVLGWLVPPAPARRLAVLRAAVGTFVGLYLVVRAPVYVGLLDRAAASFEAIGLWAWLDEPLPSAIVIALLAVAVTSSAGVAAGVGHRVAGPVFAVTVLALLTYRSSWGQILWFEVPIALFALIVGLSPAADAVRLGARPENAAPSVRYGWPVRLAGLVIVATYVIAGLAKIRYGGADWFADESMRNQIAFTAARLEVFGEASSPVVPPLLDLPGFGVIAGVGAVGLELLAPVAFLGGRMRTAWVAAVWAMHALIALTMFIVFPLPLFGVAFLPLFELERWFDRGTGDTTSLH